MTTNKKNGKMNTIKRLLKYVTRHLQLVVVLISIIVSECISRVAGIQFLKYLIDDFIVPLVK